MREKRTCSVDGCDKTHSAKGFCKKHYNRWSRYGDPNVVKMQRVQRGESCSYPGCKRPYFAKGWCSPHYYQVRKKGTAGPIRERQFWKKPKESGGGYERVHVELKKYRGSASKYSCEHCGEVAEEWAYDHEDPVAEWTPGYGFYSTEPNHYIPLCGSCHRRFDSPPEPPVLRKVDSFSKAEIREIIQQADAGEFSGIKKEPQAEA